MLKEVGRWLGTGLAGFINVFDPEVVEVGGGAVGGGELESGATRDEIRVRARPQGRDLVRVRVATLGLDSGVIGAAAIAKNFTGEPLLWGT